MLGKSSYGQAVPPPLSTEVVTERLVLRPPRTSDLPELRRVLRANHGHLKRWSPAPVPGEDPTSLTGISKLVLRHRREWKRGESYVLYVTSRASGEIVGRIALSGVMRGVFQNSYLGYWIDEAHQGRGLITEAVRHTLDFGLGLLALHRIQAAVMPVNAASLRVLDKVGFRREGLAERYLCIAGAWEDHVIFAMTEEEWREKRAGTA